MKKVSDIIIDFLVQKGITDIFGYPGGAINHLIDSASKNDNITAHVTYHEQGAAFAACGYAQSSNKLGVAFSTSGPGATNLITGIANAFFDYTPALFITGQVDSPTYKGNLKLRQRGFQETNIASMVKEVTKYVACIMKPEEVLYELEKAYYIAFDGAPGPVVLDICNDVQRAEVDTDNLKHYETSQKGAEFSDISPIINALRGAKRPVILAGNAIKQNKMETLFRQIVEESNIPCVFSMPAYDTLPYHHALNYGFIGPNGHRYSNFIVNKADCIFVIGNRLSIREIGLKRDTFAPNSKIIRVDIDNEQLNYKAHEDEISICADIKALLPQFHMVLEYSNLPAYSEWIEVCDHIKNDLFHYDLQEYDKIITTISNKSTDDTIATSDVGQNQIWVARSFENREYQHTYMSAGNGAMGFSIPAAIGAHYATHKPVIAFMGDGGLMMNVQEMQFIKREKLNIKIVCLNNRSLGMIKAWQDRYLEHNSLTSEDSGYCPVDLKKLAYAFDFDYSLIQIESDLDGIDLLSPNPMLIEVKCPPQDTFPRDNMKDQYPFIDRALFDKIAKL